MTQTLDWTFPLPRTHTGFPLGNGRTGLIVWGGGSTLRITVGRADLWDHRGGMPWTERQNYHDIRARLEANDEEGIRDLFCPETARTPGQPAKPSVLPLGRVELTLAEGWELTTARLDLESGEVRVAYARGEATKELRVGLHPERDLAWVVNLADLARVAPVTSWDLLGDRLESLSFEPPVALDGSAVDGPAGGWFWALPEDPGVWVAWGRAERGPVHHDSLAIAVGRASDAQAADGARAAALASVDVERACDETRSWWRRYWARTPRIGLPNVGLQEIHDYGLYLFAGLTNPNGVAATLQGPWIEEYDFPPWSSDYHFNINVQMCYSPAVRAGLFDHLRPLFELVWSWRDQLRRNARNFIGVEDGYMLPHAVDDRCTCMGTFWTGTIDHACTAWVAQMMHDYADYSGDVEFLREVALPFMKGVFSVYRAMMEDDGEALRLPVTVSPEYRGASMDAWGANASFQLAAVHRLCENLTAAAAAVGEAPDPAWTEVSRRLPQATLTGGESPRIALWEGVDLEESHRHHSHLAGIVPFDTIDPLSADWSTIAANSLRHWIGEGMGLWSGWCVSWASQLHARVHNGEGAELLLELWRRVFTNEGRGSMHDAVMNGLTLMGAPPLLPRGDAGGGGESGKGSTSGSILTQAERMQLDGAMGALAAVQEMLLYAQDGVIHVFPAIPEAWPTASFERMRAPGGLAVSGWYESSDAWTVEITATRATSVALRLPGDSYEARDAAGTPVELRDVDGGKCSLELEAGETAVLSVR